VATSGTPGPVHLQFRGNEGQLDLDEADLEPLVEQMFARVPPFRPEPDPAHVKAALAALEAAERPVIVAGGGVRASGGGRELVALAEMLSIPVATSLNGKDTIPGNHPLSVGVVGTYSRESANRVVAQADLVCFIGTETGGMTTHFWAVPPIGRAAVQIDVNPEALGRNYPLKAAVLGDARTTLQRMREQTNASGATRRKAWVEQCQSVCREWGKKFEPILASEAVPIRPERMCGDLTALTPENAIVVVDTGHAGMWMGAAPQRPVVCFTGDAGFWYHIGEIETAVRWKINTVTVVNNNGAGNQSMRGFDRAYGGKQTDKGRELWTFSPMNFAKIAEAMGAVGIRVDKPSELKPALQKAFTLDRPVIVDVATDVEAVAPAAVSA
jgi:acetolactate synthase-1/2/3 large subunit